MLFHKDVPITIEAGRPTASVRCGARKGRPPSIAVYEALERSGIDLIESEAVVNDAIDTEAVDAVFDVERGGEGVFVGFSFRDRLVVVDVETVRVYERDREGDRDRDHDLP